MRPLVEEEYQSRVPSGTVEYRVEGLLGLYHCHQESGIKHQQLHAESKKRLSESSEWKW